MQIEEIKDSIVALLFLLFVVQFLAGFIIAVKEVICFFVNKTKQKKAEELNRKVNAIKEYGFYYNSIQKLNEEYHFKPIKNQINLYHKANSKRSLDSLNLNDIVIYHIENNIDGFRDNFEAISANRELYANYLPAYNKIMMTQWAPDNTIACTEFKTKEEFCLFEKEMIQKITITNSFYLSVVLYAYYDSPKGKNHWYRKVNYGYDDVKKCYCDWKESSKYKISAAIERSRMTDSLRYNIFKRDNYRCQICGATQADGAKLHVDHIVPVSKGGKTVPSNLQTLCERCNLGKSNKM